MKKLLFFAFVSVLLEMAWSQPAYAWTVEVRNTYSANAVISVKYGNMFCRNDENIQIAPKGKFSVSAGACSPREVHAKVLTQGREIVCATWKGPALNGTTSFVISAHGAGCEVKAG